MRGIILGPKTDMGGTPIFTLEKVDPMVKRSILYWDRIRVPTSNVIHMESTPTIRELEGCGLLERPKAHLSSFAISNGGDFFLDIQYLLFAESEKLEPGV